MLPEVSVFLSDVHVIRHNFSEEIEERNQNGNTKARRFTKDTKDHEGNQYQWGSFVILSALGG